MSDSIQTDPAPQNGPSGLTAFYFVLVGQAASMLGTGMTNFALTIWAFEKTGLATALSAVGFAFITSMLVASPFAGAIVDRNSRKLMMIVSDLGAGLATIVVFILFSFDALEIWHLVAVALISGTANAFQWPAFSASISTLVDKENYGRANGLVSFSETTSGVLAPVFGAALLGLTGLFAILLIDIVTFVLAIVTLLFVNIPDPERTQEGRESESTFWQESMFGFRYIWERKSLFGMQMVFTFGNFFATIGFTLVAPMILARTMNNELTLGFVQMIGSIGGVIGALVMSAWGGPKRLIHGVFIGWFASGLFGHAIIGFGPTFVWWAAGSFVVSFIIPILNGSNQAIWQRKVPADLQGRVFSIRRLLAWLVNPLGTLIAGPLADFVTEPAMMAENGSTLQRLFGGIFGTTAGSGMALLIAFSGVIAALSGIWPYFVPVVRDIEELLPDHTQVVAE